MGELLAILAALIISVVVSVATYYLTPTPDLDDAKPKGLGDFNFPTNLESRYIPIVFGTTEIKAPNVIWYGDLSTEALTTAGAIVGYRYFLGIDLALCHGPLDSISAMQIDDTFAFSPGEQLSLKSGKTPQGGFVRTSSGQRTIAFEDTNSIFGGDKLGGRLIGNLAMYYGTDDQAPSSYVKQQEESNLLPLPGGGNVAQSETVPAYRGIAHVVWEGGEISEQAVIPKISFTVHRYPSSLAENFKIVNPDLNGLGDANPIHCLYEILTDTDWGLSVSSELIETQSFIEAAEQCFNEGNGFGFTVDSTMSARAVISLINDQVNGTLFQNEQGLFEYHLTRRDYDDRSLFLLDYEGNVRFTSQTSIVTDTATLEESGDQLFMHTFGGTPDLSSIEVGDPIRLTNVTETASATLYVASVDDGADEIYFNKFRDVDYSNVLGLGDSFIIYTLSGTQTVPEVNQSGILKVKSADRQSWDETFNVVQVKYLDRSEYFKETIATSHDMGNLAIRNGKQTIKKFDYQGIRSRETAAVVAQRSLRALSYPITSISVEVSRSFSNIRPSQIVKVDHPDFGLNDFFLRVLEVTLPSDRNAAVTLKGIRDTFDEPGIGEVVHIGGSSQLSAPIIVAVQPPNADEVIIDGLPLFLHNLEELSLSDYHTWHVIGQPSSNTSFGKARQLDAGEYFDRTRTGALTPVGTVIGHAIEFWEEGSFSNTAPVIAKYDRTDLNVGFQFAYGPYSFEAGPTMIPSRADSNVGDSWDIANTKAKNINGNYLYDAISKRVGRILGDMMVGDISSSASALVDSFAEDAIRQYGFGLVIVRPEWSGGDPKFDEIIAFERIEAMTIYYGAGGQNNTILSTTEPAFTRKTRKILNVFDIHRGLLDTGIQVLNGGSQVFFVDAGDRLYDLVGQTGTITDQTYRHQTFAVSGAMDMADGFDVTATAADIQRRAKPMPPKMISVNGGNYNEAWGAGTFNNKEWTNFEFPDAGTAGLITLDWGYKDLTTNTDEVNFYDDTNALAGYVQFTFNLIDDDRSGLGGFQIERFENARGYWNEGWMPTDPPTTHGTGTDLDFAATVTHYVSGTSLASYDLQAALEAAGASFSSAEDYFVEVLWRGSDSITGDVLSHGVQRNIIKFTSKV